MGDIVEISDYKPHLSGDAKCLACGYTWVCVAPAGTVDLRCPKCDTMTGVYYWLARPDTTWVCHECQNDVWFMSKSGYWCARCGNHGDYEDFIDD